MRQKSKGLNEDAITFIDIPEREAVKEMLKLEGIIDLYNPARGRADKNSHGKFENPDA